MNTAACPVGGLGLMFRFCRANVTLKLRGFSFARARPGPLRHTHAATNIAVNTPAKPMWTPVLKLKLRGFFIAPMPGQRHLQSEVAR